MSEDAYIKFNNVRKQFPGTLALDNVSFSIKKGEVHALLGENGAGKSTLLNILHGIYPSFEGEILIDDVPIHFTSAQDAIKFGIAKVHQEINMVPEMTVAQNIMLGTEPRKGILIDKEKMRKDTKKVMDRLNITIDADDKINSLSAGQIQLLQVAKALYLNAKIISFDEPTASLSSSEAETLFQIIKELKENGVTIIYISHRMDEIFRISDRASVLRDGQYIGTYKTADISKEDLIKKMIGRDVAMFAKRLKPCQADMTEVVLDVKNLNRNGKFHDISFQVHKGEILGFFGLVGAQRTEVMQCIFGGDQMTSGQIMIHGKRIVNRSPREAIRNGFALLPENRKQQGFISVYTNSQNIALPSLKRFLKGIFIDKEKIREETMRVGRQVQLKPEDPDFLTSHLSGGNQQKVIVAKWLVSNADIIIFDEPTKGIDVGAKAEIYAIMEELVENGKSVIMVSSELPELSGISDRIIVMCEGRITGEFEREEFSEDTILTCALGEDKDEKILEKQ